MSAGGGEGSTLLEGKPPDNSFRNNAGQSSSGHFCEKYETI